MKKNKMKNNILPYVLLLVFMFVVIFYLNQLDSQVEVLTYDQFKEYLRNNEIDQITITPRSSESVYILDGFLTEVDGVVIEFTLDVPLSDEVIKELIASVDEEDSVLEWITNPDPDGNSVLIILSNVLPFILLIGGTFFIISRQFSSSNKSMDFGKSKAKLNQDKGKVSFKDVAGLKEEKEEVQELIDFLKNPKKFTKLGARIPKGVLLVGPPGTGKTLLAKAVAGEANVPFYYISGSDFVELFVGVGASRVRDMFKQAKFNAPCLIFIDEIDGVGRQRGAGLGGGHDEREQTLNQLLTEMDGFGANEGIIIIAATNRPDVLDPALLRPGRFDRQVTVSLPDVKGREEILNVHAKNKTFADDVTLDNIAKRTVGLSGADLENLLNEAALLAVRRGLTSISMAEVDEAHDRVLMGPAKNSHKYSDREKKVVAYHEAGHAVLGLKLDGANEVQKITIVPRGNAGGYNLMLPKEETYLQTKKDLLHNISGLLGGRVAEEVVFDEMTTGAENDLRRATRIARSMVTEYGMSDLGPVQFEHQESSVFLGRDYNNKSKNFSSQVAFEIDQEQRKIIADCYDLTKKVINENRDLLDLIANTLLEHETITREQIVALVETGSINTVVKSDLDKLKEEAKSKKIKGYSKMTKEELEDALNKEEK